jgi:hypothetical protein
LHEKYEIDAIVLGKWHSNEERKEISEEHIKIFFGEF